MTILVGRPKEKNYSSSIFNNIGVPKLILSKESFNTYGIPNRNGSGLVVALCTSLYMSAIRNFKILYLFGYISLKYLKICLVSVK